jgi:P-type Cu+ transporter
MASEPSARPSRPVASPVPCAQCQVPVDSIRAPRISITDEGFLFFCSSECQQAFRRRVQSLPEQAKVEPRRTREPSRQTEPFVERTDTDHEMRRALHEVAQPDDADLIIKRRVTPDTAFTADEGILPVMPSIVARKAASDVDTGTLLVILAILSSLLSLALTLAGDTGAALTARVIVAAVAATLMVFELAMAPRNALSLPIALVSGPSIAAVVVAAAACAFEHNEASSLTNAACLVIIATAVNVALIRRCRASVEFERSQLNLALEPEANRFHDDAITVISAHDLRPGEEVVVGPGETVPADGTVVAGQAVIDPWHQSTEQCSVSEGASVVAGAMVVEGRLRVVISWSGLDRAWLRLAVDPRRRADLHGTWAKSGKTIALRLAPVVGGLTALTVYAAGQSLYEILAVAVCSFSAFCSVGLSELPALHVGRAVFAALRRGIAFRSCDAIDRAGRVSTATFCARGTLLLGEPEVTSIDPFGTTSTERVLELAAGAQSTSPDPTATAILRAARARNLRPDAVRSPSHFPGLGVTAVASDGQRLIVGSRGLMLKEYVSIALAESKISDLESMGRSVLLVALGTRVVGAIGLQDGMRPGARAAVQHLLDVNIEPVLLSGESRDTCEALGQTLDIDHVRPEVLPADRGDEIRRLVDGGAVVAVIGRSPADDSTLAAADLAIALNCAGGTSTDWHVQLASDDVRDAAFALRIGHHLRKELWWTLLLCIGSATAAAAVVAFALLPLGAAPVLALIGVGASVYRWYAVTG